MTFSENIYSKQMKIVEYENLNEIWKNLIRQYNREMKPISLSFKENVLDILNEKRSNNYPHYIHYYPGKIFPYIPLFLFSLKDLCPLEGIVLDPFSGSGTVLLEAIINPLYKRNALGVEKNPLGRMISKVKTTQLNIESTMEMLNQISNCYYSISDNINLCVPEFKNNELWFSKKAIKNLSKLVYSIESLDANGNHKDFLRVCFSSVIRKVAKADPFIPPPVILKPYKYKNSPKKYDYLQRFLKNTEDPDIISIFKSIVENNLKSIDILNRIEGVSRNKIKVKIIWDDAKEINFSRLAERGKIIKNNTIRPLASNSIDFIVTSPPYLTAQKYIRTHKLELLWLGTLTEKEIRELDRDLIGTERVSIKDIDFSQQIGIKSIDRLIKWSLSVSPERAASIYKYFHDMQKAISEMYRVLKNDAYAVLIVGNNTVLKKKIETYRLLTDLAISVGFGEILVLKDNIRGRGMLTKRHDSGGLIKEEYIIVLKKGDLNVSNYRSMEFNSSRFGDKE